MQIQHLGYRIRGFYRVARLWYHNCMMGYDAEQRLKILNFQQQHGTAAALEPILCCSPGRPTVQ